MKKTSKTNRLLSLALCICMVLSLLPGIPLKSHAVTTQGYDGTPVTPMKISSSNYAAFGLTESNWSGYNGYYGIRNAKELYGFANLVNGGNTGANAVLLHDIVVNETVSHTTNGAAYTWSPIGNSSRYYTGTFDGNGYTVSGLYYNENDYGQSISRIGFFGVVKGATIKNLILSNVYFRAASELSAVAACVVNYGTTISNCLLTSSVTLATDTSSDYAYTGGFIGNYYEPASVLNWNGTNTIKNCVNLGSIKLVDSSFSLGHADTSWYYTGAIAGAYRTDSNAYGQVTAENCYYLKTCVSDKNGTTKAMTLGGTNLTATSGRGGTALESASAAHTCVSATHREVPATCQYTGRSQYSFCLICGKVTDGTKNDYAVVDHSYADATCLAPATCIYCGLTKGTINPDNHAEASKIYGVSANDRTQHDYKWKCCNAAIHTENHTFDSNQKCTLCGYICEHLKGENNVCTGCGFVGVGYIDRYWDSESNQVVSNVSIAYKSQAVTASTTTLSDGWYVVNGNVNVSTRMEVSGTVHLILADGCTLNASQGVQVTTGNTLYIYGQVLGTGTLNASLSKRYHAAIGGYYTNSDDCSDGGTIIINGGNVTAKVSSFGAAIGGPSRGDFDQITINGGTVTASNSLDGAAIGSGGQMSSGPITINGGYVSATQTYDGAGIGGGSNGDGGSLVINGGTVVARNTYHYKGGAGIGGGRRGNGGTVVINGGSVSATGGDGAQAIGKGYVGTNNGTLTDGNGNAVSCYTLTLEDGDISSAASIQGLGSYSLYDVQAVDTNKVYLYLAASAAAKYVTIGDTIYCRGTSKNYSINGHSAIGDWISDNGYHYKNCANGCGGKAKLAACSGGTATCMGPGVCTLCGSAYIPVDPSNHASEDTYLEYIDDEYHGIFHACCKAEKERLEHTVGEAATCTGTAICADCGIAYGATDSANHTGELKYISNGKQNHIQIWDCCRTPNTAPEPHSLTCTAEGLTITGVCEHCGASGTVTLKPSVGGTYNGYAFTSAYEGTGLLGSWDAFVKPAVSYCCKGGCKTAGTHTVTMTLGEASVSAEFTIIPKPLTIGLVQASYKSYDGTSDLDIYSVSMDGVVVYDEGDYSGEWDDVRDDVQLVRENMVYTFDGIVPGYYDAVNVSGVTITGNDAANYVIAESFEGVPLRDSLGYDFEIHNAQIWITACDQLLIGDAQLDQSQYSIEGLDERFTIQGIVLYENSYSEIVVDPSGICVYLDGEDVTEYFEINTYPGNLSWVCEGHEFNENGFCSTGECSSYEPAVRVDDVDEWGSEVTYYDIYNAGQLYWFAEQVNTYGNNYINGRLMADITVNEDLTAENLRQWTPIGRSYPVYCGTFEGNDYTVSGLYVCDPEMDYVGLFGGTDYANSISNIHLTNSCFEGNSYVGGLFGYAGSNISGCTVSDSVTIKGNSDLGGIAGGTTYGELNNSWSAATVIANENGYSYGGLVGYNCLSINNCYTTESSLVGANNDSYGGSLNNSYYLSEEETEDGGKTAAQFASGEITWLLQSGVKGEETYDEESGEYVTGEPRQTWGQKLGRDAYPRLSQDVVYLTTDCQGNDLYSNSQKAGQHVYDENGKCTLCGETTEPDFRCELNAMEVSCDAEVLLRMKMIIGEDIIGDDNAYVVMTKNGKDTIFTTADLRAKGTDAKGRYILEQGIASGEMTYNITLKIYNGKGELENIYDYVSKEVSTSVTRSVLDYAERIFTLGTQEQKDLIAALITYGGYSQLYFGKDTSNPAYNVLTKQGMEIPAIEDITVDDFTQEISRTGDAIGITQTNSRVYLDSAIYMRVYFVLDAGKTIDGYTFTLTHSVNNVEKYRDLKPVYDAANNRYYVDIENIAAAYLDYMYTITVTDGTGTYTVQTSAMAWAKLALNAYTDINQINMIKAMYFYNQAANEFFGK